MSLPQLFSANRKGRDSEKLPDETESAESTAASTHNLPGRDPERLPDETNSESSLSDELDDANYIYYRMYVEDGAIPSKTPAALDNPFLGRIKATSVSPPHTVKTLRCGIAKVEDIKDPTKTSLFLTPYCQSPMYDTDKVTILNRNGMGSTPQEPLAFVARISDSERSELESEVAAEPDTTSLEIRYLYYRMYAEDGAIPSKTPAAPGNPFLGRIKATFVPPPHTIKTIRCSIAKLEDIKDPTKTSLFLTPYSQSPMRDTFKVVLNRSDGLGSMPQEPLAFVAKISDLERSVLESEVAAEPDTSTTPLEIRYLYYLLYANDYEKPSKVAIDPDKPSLGRIRADSVAPPHSPTTIRRCISRAESTPALAHADIFLDISSDTPLKDGQISILNCPGLSPKKPMAIALDPSLADGRYVIKNRATNIYWSAVPVHNILTVRFRTLNFLRKTDPSIQEFQWDITHDTNGNISMKSCASSYRCWSGPGDRSKSTEIKLYVAPLPWGLIRVDSKFYYICKLRRLWCSDSSDSETLRLVAAAQPDMPVDFDDRVLMATLKEGDQWQMWEFIRI